MALTSTDWLIFLFVFAIGYIVGRIITTVQYGLKFNSDAKNASKAKKDFVKKFKRKK